MKRLGEIFCSSMGLVILLPFFLLVALWIKLDSPGPVFFRQLRIGLYGKPFKIYKFRTMIADSESKGPRVTSGGDTRVTRAGRFLRQYKLDELPQLMNVFIGNMSLVGPRPEVPKYVEMFKDDYQEILCVKPGITDYAAIEFRNEERVLTGYDNPEEGYINEVLPKKIEFYRKYVREHSFWTDMQLIYLTVKRLL